LEHYLKKNIFKSSEEVFDWLSGFINLERGQKPKSFRLDRMTLLCDLAENPQNHAPSIHIAGSKGKGSVTSMLAAILAEAGFRVSRYMSPHVSDFRERVCLNGAFFSEEIYRAAGDELRLLMDESLPVLIKSRSEAAALFDTLAGGCEPTYWELLTLYFFLCSRLSECDIMVVETGLGGRLDSTNIINPLVSVITLIELEHTKFLGGTIAEIAGEKAGIIKSGKPVILAEQRGEALEVFKKKAEETKSPLYYFPEILKLTDINVTSQGTSFSLSADVSSSSNSASSLNARRSLHEILNSSFFIPIPGKVQAENAALSIIAIKTAFPQVNAETIKNGLLKTKIPARFEKISDEPVIIIDGAHTEESFSLCVQTFRSLYGESGVLIFGCASDKNPAAMARAASSVFDKIIITTPGTFKSSNPENVYKIFSESTEINKVFLIKDTREAVRQALMFSREKSVNKPLPVLGAGSFYLVAEIRNFILSE